MPLTPLTKADRELILPWRNAPAVGQAMHSHHEISFDEQRAWFQRRQMDPSARSDLYRDQESNGGRITFSRSDAFSVHDP